MSSNTNVSTPLLASKTVAVIGGSSGMGLAVAALAKQHGAELILIARDPARLNDAAASIGGATQISADLSSPDSIQKVFRDIGQLDHLVSTAGKTRHLPLKDLTADNIHALMDERLTGPLLAIQAAAPLLRPGGSITLLSTPSAPRPQAGGAGSAAAAAAVEAIVPALALELAPLRVNAVQCGMVDTPLLDRLVGDKKAQFMAAKSATMPVRRLGKPEDIAQAYLLLMTNGFITGEILRVEGGMRWI